MNWDRFVSALSQNIDWSSQHFTEREAPAVRDLLSQAQQDYSIIEERIDVILTNTDIYQSLEQFIEYPRTLMDKFTIYVDSVDRFRIRIHRFWPRCIAGNAIEKVHYHKWDMSTVILAGQYTERQFDIIYGDTNARQADIVERARATRRVGDVSSLPVGVPHQIHNPSEDEPCVTLFIRGPALQPHARIFSEPTGAYYDTFSPQPQRRHALHCLRSLNGIFHPIPEPAPKL
jgi:hypothetical protein